jgi:hypothetical protein
LFTLSGRPQLSTIQRKSKTLYYLCPMNQPQNQLEIFHKFSKNWRLLRNRQSYLNFCPLDENVKKMSYYILWTGVCVNQGSMPWSQFSAIFDNFRWKNWRFSQKKMLWSNFLHNLALFWVKNAVFCRIFRRKYF